MNTSYALLESGYRLNLRAILSSFTDIQITVPKIFLPQCFQYKDVVTLTS